MMDNKFYMETVADYMNAEEDLNFVKLVWEAYETMVSDTIPLIEMAMEGIE